jgi:4-carboxymuconolactone decarboxylase
MPQRVPSVERAKLDAKGQAVYDHIAGSRGSVRGPFGVLLHHPHLANRVADLGELLRYQGVLPGSLRELAILVVARSLKASFEWTAHHPLAVKEGTSEPAINAVLEFGITESLPPDEKLVIDTVRALIQHGRLTEPEYRAIEDAFGRQGALELLVLAGYYNALAFVLSSLDVTADDQPDPFRAR